ncbi:MAG TPA: MobF family relaxase, partial [Acidimicrobiales bacterium]|nr:MobF family relaxase [Acidimicrobiales bacterium]
MLVVRRIGEQGHRYYLAQIGPPGRGELPGEWVGAGAPALGLSGPVAETDIGRVLRGCRPDGEPLVVRRPNRVAGLDLVFAAPKSVSVAQALAGDDLAGELRRAHDCAVRAVLGYLEREACVVRQGPGNRAEADGLVGAAFRHRVSRADDPHLHTHVLVANLASGPTGRWSALHTPLVFAELRTAGSLYRAALRHEVTERLDWGWADDGLERGELLGIPRTVLVAFSQRKMQVEEEIKERHCSARVAADVTRPARHDLIDHAMLVGEWRQRAEALGFAPPGPVPHRARQPQRREPPLPAADVFTRADMVRVWSDRLSEGAPVAAVERLAEASLASAGILPTTPVARTAGPARLDGPHGQRARFTSEHVLQQRQLLLDAPRVAVVIQAGGADRHLLLAFASTGRDVVAATRTQAESTQLEATTGVVSAPLATVAAELRR